MTRLTLSSLLEVLNSFIANRVPFSTVREFVFRACRYAEEDIEIDEELELVLSVLAPYVEFEEAYGDDKSREKISRLRKVLRIDGAASERAVFALEFDRINELYEKFSNGNISKRVYDDQIKKLSPAEFDHRRIMLWAAAHDGLEEVNNNLMS